MGTAGVSVKANGKASAIDDLRMSGCLKLLFTKAKNRVETIVLNTAGGVTGGDRIALHGAAQEGAGLTLTTQAAERAYRAIDATACVRTHLSAGDGASLMWLPQELILYDGSRLERRLTCELAASSKALLVEPVVFGRHAMGEVLRDIDFRDRISIDREGMPLFRDAVHIRGDAQGHLDRPAIAAGMGAMATILYVAPDAEAKCDWARTQMPSTAGASLIRTDVLVIRALAKDSFDLRQFLVPLLDELSNDTLPISWRL